MERVVGDSPRDILEMHLPTLAMDYDDPLMRYPGNRHTPVPAGTIKGPEGSRERYVFVAAGRRKKLLVVRRDALLAGCSAGESFRPDSLVVRDVAYVRSHRPGEIRVAFGALRIGEERREFLRDARKVTERLVEPCREGKGALPARVAIHFPCPTVHAGNIAYPRKAAPPSLAEAHQPTAT